jgi:hypothetical protein
VAEASSRLFDEGKQYSDTGHLSRSRGRRPPVGALVGRLPASLARPDQRKTDHGWRGFAEDRRHCIDPDAVISSVFHPHRQQTSARFADSEWGLVTSILGVREAWAACSAPIVGVLGATFSDARVTQCGLPAHRYTVAPER